MTFQRNDVQLLLLTLTIIFGTISETSQDQINLPSNHKNVTSQLKMEARTAEVDLESELSSNGTTESSINQISSFLKTRKLSKDSYLEALEHSHTSSDPKEGVVDADVKPKYKIRREYSSGGQTTNIGPVYRPNRNPESTGKNSRISHGSAQLSDSYSLPVNSATDFDGQAYGPPQSSYGVPQSSYGVPQASYGVPQVNVGIPSTSYGPPQQSYAPQNSYLPPQQAYGPPATPSYGFPHAMPDFSTPALPSIDFSWPFALKLNAFTLAKIILKLVIFKLIVKFIAIICLLLFIPKLEIKSDDKDGNNDDEARYMFNPETSITDRLNDLTAMVTSAIEKYESLNGKEMDSDDCGIACRFGRIFMTGESWSDNIKLLKSYFVESEKAADN